MTFARDPIWDAMRTHSKEKFNRDRQQFIEKANAEDDGGWTKHTNYHWSRLLSEKRLDYWPSRKKWQYEGKIARGDIMTFIKRNTE